MTNLLASTSPVLQDREEVKKKATTGTGYSIAPTSESIIGVLFLPVEKGI
jgi:hypothetical protein